jgi:long-chain acyl-CoA synthetase
MGAIAKGIVSGQRVVSHLQREERSRRIAGGLKVLGIGQGDCVAILMRNDIAFLEATIGTAMLGAYAVPVHWHFKAEEITWILTDCGARVLIGHNDLLHELDGGIPSGVTVLSVAPPLEVVAAYGIDPAAAAPVAGATDFEAWLAAQPVDRGPRLPMPPSMIYTSGTTGRPKGVRRNAPTPEEHRKTERWRSLVYGVRRGVRALLPGPLYHTAPNSFGIRAALLAEVLVLMPRFDAEALLRLIERHRIDTVLMVPTMLMRLLQLPPGVRDRYDLSSLRHVSHTAAPCPHAVKMQMIDWWGPVIFEFLGGTETGAIAFATSEDALRKPGTVGRCTPGAELRIYDDAGNIVPPGEIGEIFGRCDGYPDFTYHNMPDKRAEVERHGFISGGDVGYLDADGYLFVCDR